MVAELSNGGALTGEDIQRIEAIGLGMQRAGTFTKADCPLTHLFAPGVYWREILLPAGNLIIGHRHKTEHFNVVLTGRALVIMDGEVQEIVAPAVLISKPGVRKVLFIKEDMRWATVHPTTETDIERLEEMMIEKSDAYLDHESELRKLEAHVVKLQPHE